MSETNKTMNDQFPDRLSVDPDSPYYNADLLARDGAYAAMYRTQAEGYL